MTKSYFKKANIIFIVFDITNIESFKNLEYWINNLKENAQYYTLVILASKYDLLDAAQVS